MPSKRRNRKSRNQYPLFLKPDELFALAAALVILALVGEIFSAPGLLSTAVYVALASAIIYALVEVITRLRVKRAVGSALATNTDALARRRAQLVVADTYGTTQLDRWEKEIAHFIETKVAPSLNRRGQLLLRRQNAALVGAIERTVAAYAEKHRPFRSLPENATPLEFEAFCAEQLRQSGWDAQLTKGSGDQGVDVIAVKRGARVVLQCKLYSKPVGNKAVQEIAAGRSHEGAQFAAVVSNRSFTPAAERLAQTNGVLLLHFSQLSEIDGLLGIIKVGRGS